MATVLILIHPLDRAQAKVHLIYGIGQCWAAAGHRVLVRAGAERAPAADLAFLHVDLPVVPPEYVESVRRYPAAVNAATGDLRKRAYSPLVLARGERHEGPVMVKSDLNSGGRPEAGKRRIAAASFGAYPVYASLRDVPPEVWEDAGLVVEKFLPEMDGVSYCVRNYYFLGNAELSMMLRSRSPEVKGENAFSVARAPVPPEIRELRRRMGFAYGKFDYVLRDGRVVLFDANRTPAPRCPRAFNSAWICGHR